ncbi:MAG: hypothetical protein ACNS60_08180 [Candidatus Cyclobacteriaceae bacterium M2_1C_046]
MATFLKKIIQKITYSSMIFWDTDIHYTPEKIFEEKIAATLHFKNKLTREEHSIELDVENYQWYMDDKVLWDEYYLETLKDSKV